MSLPGGSFKSQCAVQYLPFDYPRACDGMWKMVLSQPQPASPKDCKEVLFVDSFWTCIGMRNKFLLGYTQ